MNIEIYQPGGSAFLTIQDRYGIGAANEAAAAAATGSDVRLNNTLSNIRRTAATGKPVTDANYDTRYTTSEVFWDQITTDPLAAPLDAANDQIGKAVWNVFKNPWVLLAAVAAGIGLFIYLGGLPALKRILALK